MTRDTTDAERYAAEAVNQALAPGQESPTILEGDGIRAGYKIEVTFGPNRSSLKEYGALISLWESGKHFHGGGDSLMYFCYDCKDLEPKAGWKHLLATLDKKTTSDKGCGGPIPGAAMAGGMAMCPNCQKPVISERLTNPFPFWGTTPELASLVARYFRVLKDNADVYCKYHPTDIRFTAMEQAKGLETARRLRGMFIYPLNRILKDTTAGATLEARFRSFFNA